MAYKKTCRGCRWSFEDNVIDHYNMKKHKIYRCRRLPPFTKIGKQPDSVGSYGGEKCNYSIVPTDFGLPICGEFEKKARKKKMILKGV